ncbi:RHS repeat-associated core domain-containing protein [Nonomuraea sp. NPDC050022]|uniref:RHS repeat-associated core domain-containing protein n=1 Tax=Nonomuraea sp. NPDC050022 TaxID=3364358 RepID=UPI0037BDC371
MLVLAALLPGLLSLAAFPVAAQARVINETADAQAKLVTPKQLMGSGTHVPKSVRTSADQLPGGGASAERRERVRGALPLEVRPAVRQQAAKSDLPVGVQRAELADQQTSGNTFPMIDDTYPETGALVSATPLLVLEYSKIGEGSATDKGLSVSFKICDIPEEDPDPFPPDPVPVCVESGELGWVYSWRVPAGKLEWGKEYKWSAHVRDLDSGRTADSVEMLVTTGARQPLTSPHLGERASEGQEFAPIVGNYTSSFVDAKVAVAGPPLWVARTYNSLDARTDGIFGAGWSTQWDMKVLAERSGTTVTGLLVTYPNGRRVRFANRGNGTYQPPPGMHDALADVTGGGWRLMDTSSNTYTFDAAGRLSKIADRRGRSQTLTYGSDGTFSQITGTGGRALHFTWNGPRVATVSTDPVNGQALTWSYTYVGGNLSTVCAPVAAPNCTGYSYTDGSRYRGIVLDSEPVGYWRLGDATDSAADNLGSSGGSGIYSGVTVGQPGALEGSTDKAVGFTTSTMELPFNTLSRARDQVSVEGWFKTSQNGIIFSAGQFGYQYGATMPVLYVGVDGKLRGQLGEITNSSGDYVYTPITSAAPVNNNQWHHAVLTVSGQQQKLYLDGQAVGQVSGQMYEEHREFAYVGSGDRANSWSDIPGGQTASGAFAFKGSIDEFAVYDKPLTDAEITAHWAARTKVANKLTQTTLPSGRIWAKNTYDQGTDRLKTHIDRNGGTWQIGESEIDWLKDETTITVTDPRNGTLKYGYDAGRGDRLVFEEDQLGTRASYEYDTGGFPMKTTDRNGNVFQLWNDERGNPIEGQSCRTTVSDCQNAYATYYVNKDDEFDPRNDKMLIYRDARSADADSNTYATKWEFNQYGEQVKETSPITPDFPNGRSASVTYTDGSESAIGGGSTPAGLIASQTDARGNTWTYRYTAAGDLAEQSNPAGLLVKLSYDALGRLRENSVVSQAHPDGVKTAFTYDGLGRPATQTEPGVKNEVSGATHTKRTAFAYDPDGNKLSDTITDLTGGDAERAIVYTYDTHGKPETITDPEGGVVRQAWNAIGQLATVTDARGAVVDYGYDERGLLTSRTLKGWTGSPVDPKPAKDEVLESFTYDPGGRLETQTDVMLRTTSYSYFKDNLLEKKKAVGALLNDSMTTTEDVVLENHTYDAAGNQIQLVTGGDKSITTDSVYDAAGRLTSQTFDPANLARKTAFVYDANGNVLKSTRTGAGSTRAEVTEYAYNKVNQVTKTTVENGDQDLVSTTTYDDRGLAVASTDPRGNASGANAADFTSTMRYDALGRLIEVSGPQVKVDKAGTSSDVHPTAHFGFDTLGAKTHETDAESRTVTSVFDKAGRLTSQSAPRYTPPGGTAITPTTAYGYDLAGQLITTTDPRGYVTTFEYDKLGRQVRITDPAPDGQTPGRSIIEYYMDGSKFATVDATGARSEATYDGLGRQVTQTQIERKPAAAVYTTNLFYNQAGFLIKTVAPGNKTIDYSPNAAGEVETQIAAKGTATAITTTMAYDLAGRLIKTADGRGNSTSAEYDLAGRQIGTKDLEGTTVRRTTSAGYDLVGNQTSVTSGEGHTSRQTFDALNRATSLIEPISTTDSMTTSFGYDATGARTRLTDGRGNATWTSYNSLALAETVTEPATTAHPDPADRTWTTGYDAAGNPNVVIQPGGVRIDRTFDHLGRLTKESGAGGGAATAERTFGYDLADRPTTIGDLTVDYNDRTLPLSIKRGTTQLTGYAYDGLGNPTQRVDAAGTATFTWDANNRAETATDPVTGRKLTYGYDAANNLASLTAKTGTTTVDTQIFTYDYADRLETQTLRKGTATGTQLAKITYGWDKEDNLTTKTTAGLAGAGTNTYGYDHAGRLTSWTAPGGSVTAYEWDKSGNRTKAGSKTFTYDERSRLTSGDGTDYTYTPRGTLATETKAGATTNYTFDAFDRLIADGDSLYSYDALDRVSSRIKGAVKQNFAYAGLSNDLAALTDSSGAIQAKYGRDAGGTLLGQQEGTNPALATLTDLHGDLVATYSTTALATTTAYDPFGTVTAQTGVKTTLGYQGEYTDPDTGKVNMHARWYQPGTGAFASRDTATLDPNPSVQANRYTYANASPLTGTDPTGHYTTQMDSWGSNNPGYDDQTVADTYAQHGIVSGDSGGSGGQCIGSCGIGGGSGPIACDIWGCVAADLSRTVSVMTEEQMKWQKVLPNGMAVPKGFWSADKKTRSMIISLAYMDLPENYILGVWRMSKKVASGGGSAGGMEPDNDPTSEYTACRKVGSHSYCVKRLEDERKWQKAYVKAVQQAIDKHGFDRVEAALTNPDFFQPEPYLNSIDKFFCQNVGGDCTEAFAYITLATFGVLLHVNNVSANDAKAKQSAEMVRDAAEKVMAKGDAYVLRTLKRSEFLEYSRLIRDGKYGAARRFFGTAYHRATALELNRLPATRGRFTYTPTGDVDFYDNVNRRHVELTTFRAYQEHLERSNVNYQRSSYVLYRVGTLPRAFRARGFRWR